MSTFWQYMGFYRDWVVEWWRDISPYEYGIALILIGVFGYWLMGSNLKRL